MRNFWDAMGAFGALILIGLVKILSISLFAASVIYLTTEFLELMGFFQ